MLKYNFERLFQQRGIVKPLSFLLKAGFNRNFASRLINGRTNGFSPRQLEMLCNVFRCTPNDLMEWKPDKPEDVNESNRLTSLIRSATPLFNLSAFTSDMPFDTLPEFAKKVDEIKKEILAKGKIS